MVQRSPLPPANPEVSAALERVLSSAIFARSARLASFLRFIVNEYLVGCESSPKEYVLGVRVFNRDPNYDPRIDPIVRVQARQLRFKLREYYETVGHDDPIRIEIPKGSYLPAISYAVDGSPVTGAVEPGYVEPPQAAPTRPQAPRRSKALWIFAAALAVAAAAGGILFARFSAGDWPHRQAKINPAAHDLYLKGTYYWSKRTPESLNQAVDYFTQAIVKDPSYAKAYAGLADCYNLLREYSVMPGSAAWPRAIAAAQKAVELDDSSPEAHASLGFALFYGGLDPSSGEREYRRAIELDYRYPKAHHWYATSLMTIGRLEEAFAEIERARELDPTSPSILSDEGYIFFYQGRTPRAVELLKQVEMVDPSFASPHIYLARIYLHQGDCANYLLEAQRAAELSHDNQALASWAAARKAFAEGGLHRMLEAILQNEESLLRDGHATHYAVAQACVQLDKRQEAIDHLQAAVENRELDILALGQDPLLAPLHGEPRYEDLQRKVKQSLRI